MQVQIEGFILFGCYAHEANWTKPYFTFKTFDEVEGFVTVRPHSLTVEVPGNFDPRPLMVERLQAEKKKVEAEFQARVTQINAQIQSLLAIEA